MKKNSIITLTLFMVILWMVNNKVHAEKLPGIAEDIATAIKTGNAKDLAKNFSQTVEIRIPGSDGAFSKAQAEMILKDFFAKSPPISFVVNQKGNSAGGAQFIIGTYKNKAQSLNVYILLKPNANQMQIQQLHFEAD